MFNNTVVVPNGSQWAILAVESDSLWIVNNILISFLPKDVLISRAAVRITTAITISSMIEWQLIRATVISTLHNGKIKVMIYIPYWQRTIPVCLRIWPTMIIIWVLFLLREILVAARLNLVSTDLDNERDHKEIHLTSVVMNSGKYPGGSARRAQVWLYFWNIRMIFWLLKDLKKVKVLCWPNLFGQVIERAERINISNLTHGIYFISIVSHNGYLLATVKVDI